MRYPRLQPLDTAVARMTEAAQSEGRNNLVMTTQEWKSLFFSGMRGGVRDFGMEMVSRTADAESLDIVNRWLALAMDIWNAMPETVRLLELRRMEQSRINDSPYVIPVGEPERDDPVADHTNERYGERDYVQL